MSRQSDECEQELDELIYAVSHDLREPLRAVQGFCDLLNADFGDGLGARGKEYLGFVVDGSRRMDAMLDGLLQYSRLRRAPQQIETADLTALVQQTAAECAEGAHVSAESVTIEPLSTLEVDSNQMRELFRQLIDNAIRYAPDPASCRITVSAKTIDGETVISVCDNGAGFPAGDRTRAFRPLQKMHAEEQIAGVGMGLAICRWIVRQHGGRIWIADEQPTTVCFTLSNTGD